MHDGYSLARLFVLSKLLVILVRVSRASRQTISNAVPGNVPSLYDPRKGGNPNGTMKVGVRVEDASEYGEEGEEYEDEEEEASQRPQYSEAEALLRER